MKIFVSVLLIVLTISCSENKRKQLPEKGYFGQAFTTDSCIDVTQINDNMIQTDSLSIIVCGKIGNYCKGEGCWLSIDNPNGKPLLVENKNKSFIVPFDIGKKSIQAKGVLLKMEPNAKYGFKLIATGVLIQ
jgi:hypothetical protein